MHYTGFRVSLQAEHILSRFCRWFLPWLKTRLSHLSRFLERMHLSGESPLGGVNSACGTAETSRKALHCCTVAGLGLFLVELIPSRKL